MPKSNTLTALSRMAAGAMLMVGTAVAAAAPAQAQGTGNAPAAAGTLAPATAAQFINQLGDKLMVIVNSGAPMAQRQAQTTPLIDNNVDVDGIARFCLGRFWRMATPAQQQEYVALFHKVLVNSVTLRLGDYKGVTFATGQAHARADGMVVSTTITRPSNAPNAVDWLVSDSSGKPMIEDMIAEGTSLRLTQRSDYAGFLSHNNNNIQALIDALRKQVSG